MTHQPEWERFKQPDTGPKSRSDKGPRYAKHGDRGTVHKPPEASLKRTGNPVKNFAYHEISRRIDYHLRCAASEAKSRGSYELENVRQMEIELLAAIRYGRLNISLGLYDKNMDDVLHKKVKEIAIHGYKRAVINNIHAASDIASYDIPSARQYLKAVDNCLQSLSDTYGKRIYRIKNMVNKKIDATFEELCDVRFKIHSEDYHTLPPKPPRIPLRTRIAARALPIVFGFSIGVSIINHYYQDLGTMTDWLGWDQMFSHTKPDSVQTISISPQTDEITYYFRDGHEETYVGPHKKIPLIINDEPKIVVNPLKANKTIYSMFTAYLFGKAAKSRSK